MPSKTNSASLVRWQSSSGIEPTNLLNGRYKPWSFCSRPNVIGIGPVNLLPSNVKINKLLKLPIARGMLPIILQLAMRSIFKDMERLPIELGRKPSSGFPFKFKDLNFLQFAKEERKLNFEVEDVKELLAKPSHSRFLKFPIVFGIKPENVFPPNSRKESLEALVMELGMVPENLLSAKLRCSIIGSERSILDGRLPERELLMRISTFSDDMLKIIADTTPTRLFIPSTKASRFRRLAISWGISPGKLT